MALGQIGILSRLLVALALAIFGVAEVQAERVADQSGPAAESRIDQAQSVITAKRHLVRPHLTGDDTTDPAGQVAAPHVPLAPAAVCAVAAEVAQRHPANFRILPPVRGPPAA